MTYESLVSLRNTINSVGKIIPVEGGDRLIIEGVSRQSYEDNGDALMKVAEVWNALPRVFEEIFRLNEDHNRLTNAIASIHDKSTEVLQNTSRGMVAEDYWQALDD